jgi:hypothetical protein
VPVGRIDVDAWNRRENQGVVDEDSRENTDSAVYCLLLYAKREWNDGNGKEGAFYW